MYITGGLRITNGFRLNGEYVAASVGDTPDNVTGATVVAQSPFAGGGNSYSFTGSTSSYIYYNGSSNYAFGTGDYTIEWWQYDLGSGSFPRIFWYAATAGAASPSLGHSQEGSTASRSCYIWPAITNMASTAIATNTWYHFAIVRISGKIYFYKNGTLLNAGGTVNTTNTTDTTSKFYIATKSGGGASNEQFYGYITNFRVCKGLGVYTGNFTTPTSALGRTQSSGTNISAITNQCVLLVQP